jgi:hypothetical protein
MHMQHLSPCFGQVVEEVARVTEGNGCEQRPAEDEHIRRRVPAGTGYLHPLDEKVDPVPHHGEAGDSEEEVKQLEQALEEPPARCHLLFPSLLRRPINRKTNLPTQTRREFDDNSSERTAPDITRRSAAWGRRKKGLIDYLAGDSSDAVLPFHLIPLRHSRED